MDDIALTEIQSVPVAQLRSWLQVEQVRRWFPDPDDVLEWARDVPQNGRHRLIMKGAEAVGYLRWSYVPRDVLDALGFDDLPADSADIDLFIGSEQHTGRGFGRRALELAIDELRAEGVATVAALTTSVENTTAHGAFERAGFRIDRTYTPEGFGPCYLMLRVLFEFGGR
ncbi:MAG: GNAT family N-acetyltransferase [Woeseiaceae bacterium]|nr:GNAT family N-acetyltransferase [Woeseiaceae bacterium]